MHTTPTTTLSPPMVWLFATACGLCVANVYYAQPLLDSLAHDFAIAPAAVGGVVSATQLGCALALLLLVPLGDRLPRRALLSVQLLALAAALLMVAGVHSRLGLLAAMLAVGMLGTAMTQGLIACAAAASTQEARGAVVGAAQSGVFLGLLLARVVSGVISDMAGWRAVYVCAALVMLALWLPLWRGLGGLPALAQRPASLRMGSMLASMLQLLRHDRSLQVRGMLALFMFASFNIFWSALALPLSAPPHALPHSAIGAFALVGVAGALMATRAGRDVDRGLGQRTSLRALWLLLLAWLPLALMPYSLWALLPGILMLDLGGQALHVTNQGLILRRHPEAHGRLVGLYMLFYAVGSALGGILATATYAWAGWPGVCLAGAMTSLAALLFWRVTRHVPM